MTNAALRASNPDIDRAQSAYESANRAYSAACRGADESERLRTMYALGAADAELMATCHRYGVRAAS